MLSLGPSRYWLFSDVVPGLYIEKGWVHESIDYSFTPPPEDKPAEPEAQEEEEDDEEEDEEGGGAANEGVRRQIHTSAIRNFSLWRRRCTDVFVSAGADKDDGSVDGAMSEGAHQGAAPAEVCIETTVPKQGQNLW